MKYKLKTFSWDEIQNEMKVFRSTSVWQYLKRKDWDNVWRKWYTVVWYPVKRFFKDFYWGVKYRTTHRYHKVDTDLRPGYYDVDSLLLHSSFNLLKKFVEVELAWMHLWTVEKNLKWYQSKKKFVRKYGRELGLLHLNYWNTVSVPNDWQMDEQQLQKLRDKDSEIRNLYLWWTQTRSARTDPYEDRKEKDDEFSWKEAYDVENRYCEEDTEYLCRLARVRENLWT